MKVSNFMRLNPPCVKLGDPFKKVVDIFKEIKIESIQVLDENDDIQGIISHHRAFKLLSNSVPQSTLVDEIMVSNVITMEPDVPVEELIKWNVSSLPVVENKKVLGLITLSDTIQAYNASMLELQHELSAVIKAVYNGIISVDSNKQIRFINKSAEEAFGINFDDIKGADIDQIIEKNIISEVVETGNQIVNRRIEYGNKAFMTNCSCVRDENDKIVGAVCSFQDSTGLEETYRELLHTREMTEELNAIIESSFDGILVTNNDGIIKKVNTSFYDIIDSNQNIIGKKISVLKDIIDIEFFYLLQQKKTSITTSCTIKEGGELLISANPIFNSEGKIEGMVANVRDITSLRMLENRVEALNELYKNEIAKTYAMKNYVFEAPASKNVMEIAMRVAKVESTILITGESGVGKEVVATLIHTNSSRKGMPFIKINCGAIPEALLESELFGYEAGAFTGAQKKGKPGIFEVASQGTLLLDEVGDLPLHLQVKLLRAIQEQEITRVGGVKPVKIDVRIIAATNKDLKLMMDQGEFRKDLYYRLNVIPIYVPALRERREDLITLSNHYLKKFNQKYGAKKVFGHAAMESVFLYDWPGNVRELENIIERAAVKAQGDIIENLGLPISEGRSMGLNLAIEYDKGTYKDLINEFEKKIIISALEKYKTTRKAGEALGIDQSTIVKKASKLGISIK